MWRTYLIQVVTGQIGPAVEFESASWSISLNETENFSGELKKSALPKIDKKEWLSPWKGGVLLTWNDIPIFAGPIVARPTEYVDKVHLECRGIRSLLGKRYLVKEHTDWSTFRTSIIEYKNMSLGTIAKKIVQDVQKKPGGLLPITYPIADEIANHQRTYKGYNVQNLNCDVELTSLSDASRGPDMMFRPRKVDDSRLVWDFWTGSEGNPHIPQSYAPIWDTSAQQGSVTNLQVISTGAHQTNRVFGIGAGTDAETLIHMEENLKSLDQGFPFLESTVSANSSESANVVQSITRGSLNSNLEPLAEISMTVRADGVYPLGTFWCGNSIELVISNDWIFMDAGIYPARLLNVSGTIADSDIRLSLQTER
jgi:hypothetical protein